MSWRESFELIRVTVCRSDYLRIIERGSGYAVAVEIKENSIPWLMDLLHKTISLLEQVRLVKKRDEGDRVTVFQRKWNDRGRYILLSVTPRNSRGRHIIILVDH